MSKPHLVNESEYWNEMAGRMRIATYNQCGELLEEAKCIWGISRNTFYRKLAKHGYTSRRNRSDKGQVGITFTEMQEIAKILVNSNRANNKRLLSLEAAIKLARANGAIKTKLSASQISRVMNAHNMLPKQLKKATPHQNLKSLHPNYCWEFDVSICILYYMKDEGDLGLMKNSEFYKNKPENFEKVKKKRLLRYLITDHASGAFYLRYYLGAGESTEILFDFLMRAFNCRDDDSGMYGVPRYLVWDAGSANQSSIIQSLLRGLDVKYLTHIPGNPRAKGQVERTHNLVETSFEGLLSFDKVAGLEDLNAKATNWRLAYNLQEKLRRADATRYELWNKIEPSQLRLPPSVSICQGLLREKLETRIVRGDLTISYQTKGYPSYDYSVANVTNITIGSAIQVCVNPYKAPNIFVVTDAGQVACDALKKDAYGFYEEASLIGAEYKRPIDTVIEQNNKGLEAVDTRLNAFAHIDPRAIPSLPNKIGMRIKTDDPLMRRELSTYESYQYLQLRLGEDFDVIKDGLYEELAAASPWSEEELDKSYPIKPTFKTNLKITAGG